jgi:hypothetical protein
MEVVMKLFRELSKDEEESFREWARVNYEPFTPINGVWHPVVQDECQKINSTADFHLDDIGFARGQS